MSDLRLDEREKSVVPNRLSNRAAVAVPNSRPEDAVLVREASAAALVRAELREVRPALRECRGGGNNHESTGQPDRSRILLH